MRRYNNSTAPSGRTLRHGVRLAVAIVAALLLPAAAFAANDCQAQVVTPSVVSAPHTQLLKATVSGLNRPLAEVSASSPVKIVRAYAEQDHSIRDQQAIGRPDLVTLYVNASAATDGDYAITFTDAAGNSCSAPLPIRQDDRLPRG